MDKEVLHQQDVRKFNLIYLLHYISVKLQLKARAGSLFQNCAFYYNLFTSRQQSMNQTSSICGRTVINTAGHFSGFK